MKTILYIIISLFYVALTTITGYVFIFAFCSIIGCTIYRELFMTIFIAAPSLIIVSWIIFLLCKKSRMFILSVTPVLLSIFCISFMFIYRTHFHSLHYHNGYYATHSHHLDVYSRFGYKFGYGYAKIILGNGNIAILTLHDFSEEYKKGYNEEIHKISYHATIYFHNKIGKLVDSQSVGFTSYRNQTNESDSYIELPSGKYINDNYVGNHWYEILIDGLELHNNL